MISYRIAVNGEQCMANCWNGFYLRNIRYGRAICRKCAFGDAQSSDGNVRSDERADSRCL